MYWIGIAIVCIVSFIGGMMNGVAPRGRRRGYSNRSRSPKVGGLLSLANEMERSRKRRWSNRGVRGSILRKHRR